MIKVELSLLNGDTFYAGEEIKLEIFLKKQDESKTIQ